MEHFLVLIQNFVAAIKSGQLPQLGYWTYVLLAMLVALEGPIATLLGAAAASTGLMYPELVFASAATGNLIADSLWYSLGYLGKREWIMHVGRWFGLREKLIKHMKQQMLEHAAKMLFLAKLTVSFVIPSLIAAGLLRVPWRRWFPALVVAETLWTGSLVLIGYYTTETIKRVETRVEYTILGISIIFIGFVIITGRRLIKQWNRSMNESNLS